MGRKINALVVAAALCVSAAHNAVAAPPTAYQIDATGLTDTFVLNGVAINNAGQIPVTVGQQTSIYQNGTFTPADYSVNNNNSVVINNLGHVAGMSSLLPYLWTGGATATQLPAPTLGADAFVFGLNDHDVVVGEGFAGPGASGFAVMWQNNVMTNVIAPAPTESVANAINNSNNIVGRAFGIGGPQRDTAFFWHDGTLTPLPNLATFAGRSEALDINETNQVVGWENDGGLYFTSMGTQWQFDADGNPIATSLMPSGSHLYSKAFSINNHGVSVGMSFDDSSDLGSATLWQNGQAYDLNTLIPADSGWVLVQAKGINDSGQIVGFGSFEGTLHSFIMTPVPEPTVAAIALILGSALLVRRRARKVSTHTRR